MKIERVEKIFDRLGQLEITLPPDPAGAGPEYLAELASQCRGYLNEVSHYLQEVLVEAVNLNYRLNLLETAYKIKSDDMLTNDASVKDLPSLVDRQAKIGSLLKNDFQEIETVKGDLRNNANVEKVVKMRMRELDNTMSTIRLQKSLITTTLTTGSDYGDTSSEGRGQDVMRPKRRLLIDDSDDMISSFDFTLKSDGESVDSLAGVEEASEDIGLDASLTSDEVESEPEEIPEEFQGFIKEKRRTLAEPVEPETTSESQDDDEFLMF